MRNEVRAPNLSLICAVAFSILSVASPAKSQEPPAHPGPRDDIARKAEEAARADFQAANYGQAIQRLDREIERCGAAECSPSLRARLLCTLGLVQAAGLRKADDAVASFEQALQADPQATLPTGSPQEATKLFEDVRSRVMAPTPEPASSPSTPPTTEVPTEPLQNLGDARWTEIGLIRANQPPAAPDDAVSLGAPLAIQPPSSLRLDEVAVHLRAGWVDYAPINDDETDEATDLGGVWFGLSVRPEWRSVTSLVGVWLDFGLSVTPRVKGALQMPSSDAVPWTPMHGSLTHLALSGQGGIDLVPVGFVSLGPLIGYRGDLYIVKLDDDMSVKSSSAGGSDPFFDHGIEYGGHVRVRTAQRMGIPPILYGDAAMFHRKGRFLTGSYQRFEVGFQPGNDFSLVLSYQVRTGASGYVGLADVGDPADALGSMMPVERMIGIGVGVVSVASEGAGE
jgi:hypothetical protein